MSDEQIVEYLRSRGRVEPPANLVRSVTEVLDDAGPSRSWFAPFVPAAAVTAAVGAVLVVALLLGQGPSIGPDPDASPAETPGPAATIGDLEAALAEATAVLRRAPAVEGWQDARIRGEQASVTWFDWRSNGDAVVVQRVDVDVMQSGWWVDPDGQPPATERNVSTQIWVVVGSELYSGTDEWRVSARDETPAVLDFGTGILDGEVDPWQPLAGRVDPSDRADARVTHLPHADGGGTWTLETPYREGTAYQIWTIAGGGDLRSWTWEVVGASPDPDAGPSGNVTTASLKFMPREDASPIRPPNIEAPPDPDDFGVPADLPLGG